MKKNELIINDENISKTLINDVLKRKPTLMQLIKLLNVLEDNYTISIDGDWGVGKTFFVKQLLFLSSEKKGIEYISDEYDKENLEKFKKLYIPIYYNAWENDDHKKPLESIIYNILDAYSKFKGNFMDKKQDLDEIIKHFLSNIIEKGTFGFITKENLDKVKTFEDLSKSITTIEETKNDLYQIFSLLTKNKNRILLIIDELDRCKPDYAVKVLETVKHFYNYKNITTLVVTNNKQLSESVKHFYGYNFDGYAYLNKMYDTVLSLNINNIDDYLFHYLKFSNDHNISEEISYFLIKYLGFNLRECNSFVSMYNVSIKYINLSYGFNKEKYMVDSNVFLPIGLALKTKDIKEYYKYIKGDSDDFLKEFIQYIYKNDIDNNYISWLSKIFKVKDSKNLEQEIIKSYHNLFNPNDYHVDRYPILDALSLLGNLVSYNENEQ